MLAGCAGDSADGLFTTGSLERHGGSRAQDRSRLRDVGHQHRWPAQGGHRRKIEKAAAKKYKMTAADLKKADQLTKANADFQQRCSTIPPKPTNAQAAPGKIGAELQAGRPGPCPTRPETLPRAVEVCTSLARGQNGAACEKIGKCHRLAVLQSYHRQPLAG